VVRVSCAGLQWEVIKRYSEFRQLHSHISDLPLPKELKKRLPKLPPRQLIGKEDDKFITTRMQLLDVYLAQLVRGSARCCMLFLAGVIVMFAAGESIVIYQCVACICCCSLLCQTWRRGMVHSVAVGRTSDWICVCL